MSSLLLLRLLLFPPLAAELLWVPVQLLGAHRALVVQVLDHVLPMRSS